MQIFVCLSPASPVVDWIFSLRSSAPICSEDIQQQSVSYQNNIKLRQPWACSARKTVSSLFCWSEVLQYLWRRWVPAESVWSGGGVRNMRGCQAPDPRLHMRAGLALPIRRMRGSSSSMPCGILLIVIFYVWFSSFPLQLYSIDKSCAIYIRFPFTSPAPTNYYLL